ncbi:unnamed protein product [Polarella glacialis]|uniref:Uncharacterized protein n=1 Tax=Polarella glacialis TaxID=89957 RepID=A0A813KAH8_POLGL|nr:unnamed protein product [Polarella glacialis]
MSFNLKTVQALNSTTPAFRGVQPQSKAFWPARHGSLCSQGSPPLVPHDGGLPQGEALAARSAKVKVKGMVVWSLVRACTTAAVRLCRPSHRPPCPRNNSNNNNKEPRTKKTDTFSCPR